MILGERFLPLQNIESQAGFLFVAVPHALAVRPCVLKDLLMSIVPSANVFFFYCVANSDQYSLDFS